MGDPRPEANPRADGDDLEPYRARLEAIAALEPRLEALSDRDLGRRAAALGERVRAGAGEQQSPDPARVPDQVVVEVFALVREAARRAIGLRPYDVQLAGGLALHQGKVAEMATGEGKTLAAVAPTALAALAGRGAHVLTVNDYLARRDAAWMGPVYERLGLTVGCVQDGMAADERRRAYASDVTYLTARECGFDLLRDGLCLDPGEQVHRRFHFALVDEADSILIDEARIPLVIAGAAGPIVTGPLTAGPLAAGLGRIAAAVRRLEAGTDFDFDEHGRNVALTDAGAARVEAILGCGSLFDPGNEELLAAVRNALHAEALLERDVDYIVRRGAVELVDEFTGRVAEKRHWPDGLHGAVEAKEGLALGADGELLGSITLQHLIRLYPRRCGMTATARSAAEELAEVYGLEVAAIPSHRPCVRRDLPDRIYSHRAARDRAVAEEVAHAHAAGRPVLVGTASVAESERLAGELRRRGVPCRVLNARHDEREAAIVARAGALGAVTISTNMAGRGTDVRLGGPAERDRERVAALGGLYVVGTHRHESERIDRQLRGRAGRQGDPGSSRFFLALDDPLLSRYGIERLIPAKLFPERSTAAIDSAVVRREVARAQRIVEGECADARRRLYAYSEVIEKQRLFIADWRQAVLDAREKGVAEDGRLEERCGERWRALSARVEPAVLAEIERRLTLAAIDRCWGEYLTEMQAERDEIHLVSLDGRQPLAEFTRRARDGFERLLERIDDTAAELFAGLEVGPDGVDWEAHGLRGPAATWTYLVSDDVLGSNPLFALSSRASLGLIAVLALGPVLFLWGLAEHWRRWRAKRRDR